MGLFPACTDGVHHTMQEGPKDVAAAGASFWARSRELGFPDWISVHEFFGVLQEKGGQRRRAEASARGAGIPLSEAIRRMREELAALPEGWAPAGPTLGDRGTLQCGDVPAVEPVTGFPSPLATAPGPNLYV